MNRRPMGMRMAVSLAAAMAVGGGKTSAEMAVIQPNGAKADTPKKPDQDAAVWRSSVSAYNRDGLVKMATKNARRRQTHRHKRR